MTFFALILVLAAAFSHATWNLLAKRVGAGGAVFVWLFGVFSVFIYAPLAVVLIFSRSRTWAWPSSSSCSVAGRCT